jgi:hypothetical protein
MGFKGEFRQWEHCCGLAIETDPFEPWQQGPFVTDAFTFHEGVFNLGS